MDQGVFVYPDPSLCHRTTGSQLLPSPPKAFPLLAFKLDHRANFAAWPGPVIRRLRAENIHSPVVDLGPPTTHIRLDVPRTFGDQTVQTPMQVLKVMNDFAADESSSILASTTLRYPMDISPHLVRNSPPSHLLIDLFVPSWYLQRLVEDDAILSSKGITWQPLQITNALVILRHLPGQKLPRQSSAEVRDSIKLIPHLRDQFDRIVLLNRADAAGSTRAGVDLGVLSQQLQDLDHISLYRADNLQKIFPRTGGRPVVSPHKSKCSTPWPLP